MAHPERTSGTARLRKHFDAWIGDDLFPKVARGISLLLALAAVAFGATFMVVLVARGQLSATNVLTFVGFLLAAAGFFANAGKPTNTK